MTASHLLSQRIGMAVASLAIAMATGWSSGHAQPFDKPVRIGVLTNAWGPPQGLEGLVDALVEMGYEENVDFVVGVRFTQGDPTALGPAAQALVAGGVDILVPVGPLAVDAARAATSTQPVVFMGVADPIGRGLVQSFARPGGNVTGITDFNIDLSGKRLEFFSTMVPEARRILFAFNSANPYNERQSDEYRGAADQLDLVLVEREVRSEDEARTLFANLHELDVDGVLSPNDVDFDIPGFILRAAASGNIPTMFDIADFVERGGLASYGVDYDAAGRQAARLIDRILRGADPAETPVETAIQLELVINLRTAERLGVTVPIEVLLQADRVLE